MGHIVKSPESDQEWHDYFELRWEILRAPWQQPHGSERDELEDDAFHVMALDEHRHTVGTGRLHRLSGTRAQIRYMAVDPRQQGKGIGSQLLTRLEDEARNWGCQEIILNARTTSLEFYQRHNYQIVGDAPVLFGRIAHKQMRKKLN